MLHYQLEYSVTLFAQQNPVQYPHMDISPLNNLEGTSGGFVVGVFVGIALTKYILK